MYVWSYWSRRARIDEYLLQKAHFKHRIYQTKVMLEKVLSRKYREQFIEGFSKRSMYYYYMVLKAGAATSSTSS